MRTVTIFGAGPSLPQALLLYTKTCTRIAVNLAAEITEHEHWAIGDAECMERIKANPTDGLLHCTNLSLVRTCAHNQGWTKSVKATHWDDVRCAKPHLGVIRFTLEAAIAYAARVLKAERVDLLGCDWAGNGYFKTSNELATWNALTSTDRWTEEPERCVRMADKVGVQLFRFTPTEEGMEEQPLNRMARDAKPGWQPAKTVIRPPERVICCPNCASPKTKVRATQPADNIVQRVCVSCGSKFASRNEDGPQPEARFTRM